MALNMMTDKGLATNGAVCLDGTAAGFYFAPVRRPHDSDPAAHARALLSLGTAQAHSKRG